MDAVTAVRVSDGKSKWVYRPEEGNSAKALESIGRFAGRATIAREETLTVRGQDHDCYVIAISPDLTPGKPPRTYTYWVEKGRPLVWQAIEESVQGPMFTILAGAGQRLTFPPARVSPLIL